MSDNHYFIRTCANCTHCVKVNRNHLYAVCDENGRVFMSFGKDTRTSCCDNWKCDFEHLNESEKKNVISILTSSKEEYVL